jgi:hypothetical protein
VSSLTKFLNKGLICLAILLVATNLLSSEFYPSSRQHYRTAIRHIEKGGIGYNKGYTTFEGFFATDPKKNLTIPFLDLRAHVFNDGKLATNIGLGFRKNAGCLAYGLNAYYDYRKTSKLRYNQIGFGLEALGQRCDFRINAYLPVGHKITDPYGTSFAEFSGHELLLSQNYEFGMKGFNAELGGHLNRSENFDLYLAAGTYHYTENNGPKFWGAKARLTCRIKDYATIEFSNSYDKYFRNRFQGQVTLTIPLGRESEECSTNRCNSCDTQKLICSKMVQPVERQEIIVVANKTVSTQAINPLTGLPFYFVFVDNTSNSLGTYESPYPTLTLAQDNSSVNDVIYVFPGDGTTNGMDSGISLKSNQKFFGAGTSHAIQTSQGLITIPAQSLTNPIITNTIGDGVTLADINEVSGFTISSAANRGIFGTDNQDIIISKCSIDNSVSNQIHIESASDESSTYFDELTITDGQSSAIYIDSPAQNATCVLKNSIINNNSVYVLNYTFDNQATVNITNNNITENENSINAIFNGPGTITIADNQIQNTLSTSEPAVFIQASTSPVNANIENNNISNNASGAIQFLLEDTNGAELNLTSNTINSNELGAVGPFGAPLCIRTNSTSSGNCELNLNGNTVSENAGFSLYCADGSFNNFTVTANQNSFNANGGGLGFSNDCNTFNLTANNNTITSCNDNAIAIAASSITTANLNLSANQINNTAGGGTGIAIASSGTSLNLTAINNTITNNEGSGITMYSASPIENVEIQIENNTITDNQNIYSNTAGGIGIEQYVSLSGKIANNTLENNLGPYAFYVESTDASANVCLEMTGNSNDRDYSLSNPSGIFNLTPCNVASVNIGTITTSGTITNVQSCPSAEPCS